MALSASRSLCPHCCQMAELSDSQTLRALLVYAIHLHFFLNVTRSAFFFKLQQKPIPDCTFTFGLPKTFEIEFKKIIVVQAHDKGRMA